MSISKHIRDELLFFLGINGMETSVALAQEGNPFTGESFMCKEVEATFEGVR